MRTECRIIRARGVFHCMPRTAKDGGRAQNRAADEDEMRKTTKRIALLCGPAAAVCALLLPITSEALINRPGAPTATTGSVSHVRGTSAVLDGTVQPHGLATTYYFQYGPTVAYGTQTPSATLPPGYARIRVGITVVGLRLGEHYRLVASNADGTFFGRDRAYTLKSTALKFVLPKERNTPPIPYDGTYVLRGTLTGVGNTTHKLVLEASRYPYLEPFTVVTSAATPSATGSFIFRVSHMTTSTQFRVISLDPRPLLSPVVTAQVSVRVTLKVRSSARKGFVRLYGTVTPALVHARVAFQLLKAVRPGRSERETAFATQFTTRTKHGTRSVSRFSFITRIRRRGYYRAYVQLKKGALVSGASNVVHLNAAPGSSKGRRR
jgi:hypothetical protein